MTLATPASCLTAADPVSGVLSRAGPGRAAVRPVAQAPAAALALGRVHEICGPARCTLALAIAGALADRGPGGGMVLWIRPGWQSEALHPAGMAGLLDPGRLIVVDCLRAEDMLWCAEEGLRAGAVPLVVAALPDPPGLTPVRRLHLAAQAGAVRAGQPPLGLLLTPGEGGAAGVESRWHMAPLHDAGHSRWQLERRRARGAGPAAWHLAPGPSGLRVQAG